MIDLCIASVILIATTSKLCKHSLENWLKPYSEGEKIYSSPIRPYIKVEKCIKSLHGPVVLPSEWKSLWAVWWKLWWNSELRPPSPRLRHRSPALHTAISPLQTHSYSAFTALIWEQFEKVGINIYNLQQSSFILFHLDENQRNQQENVKAINKYVCSQVFFSVCVHF